MFYYIEMCSNNQLQILFLKRIDKFEKKGCEVESGSLPYWNNEEVLKRNVLESFFK